MKSKKVHKQFDGFKIVTQVFNRDDGFIPTIDDMEPEYIISEPNICDEIMSDHGSLRHEMDAAHNSMIRKKLEIWQSMEEPEEASISKTTDPFNINSLNNAELNGLDIIEARNMQREAALRTCILYDDEYREAANKFLNAFIPECEKIFNKLDAEILEAEKIFKQQQNEYLKKVGELKRKKQTLDHRIYQEVVKKFDYANKGGYANCVDSVSPIRIGYSPCFNKPIGELSDIQLMSSVIEEKKKNDLHITSSQVIRRKKITQALTNNEDISQINAKGAMPYASFLD